MPNNGFLHRYFLANGHKRLHKWVHYFDIYEHHFARFRDRQPTVLEIGVQGGGSLAMWRAYFGESATILGLDIDPSCSSHEADGIRIYIGSQNDPAVLAQIMAEHPVLDVIIDDGSHLMADLKASFDYLYPRISPEGVYLVEDTHTCYWPEYGGGLGEPASFIEFVKSKLDEINALHTRGAAPVTDFTRTTRSICFYDSAVVFEKAPQGMRQSPVTGAME